MTAHELRKYLREGRLGKEGGDALARLLTMRQPPSDERARTAAVVLNQEEVVRLFEAAPGLKYIAAFGVAYGAGLRVSEVEH